MQPPQSHESESPPREDLRAQVHRIASEIPAGHVMNYGAIGAACNPPISGYVCGKMMRGTASDVPWWRVVAKDGSLPVSKRMPRIAQRQRELLEAESVVFDEDGKVPQKYFYERPGSNLSLFKQEDFGEL